MKSAAQANLLPSERVWRTPIPKQATAIRCLPSAVRQAVTCFISRKANLLQNTKLFPKPCQRLVATRATKNTADRAENDSSVKRRTASDLEVFEEITAKRIKYHPHDDRRRHAAGRLKHRRKCHRRNSAGFRHLEKFGADGGRNYQKRIGRKPTNRTSRRYENSPNPISRQSRNRDFSFNLRTNPHASRNGFDKYHPEQPQSLFSL